MGGKVELLADSSGDWYWGRSGIKLDLDPAKMDRRRSGGEGGMDLARIDMHTHALHVPIGRAQNLILALDPMAQSFSATPELLFFPTNLTVSDTQSGKIFPWRPFPFELYFWISQLLSRIIERNFLSDPTDTTRAIAVLISARQPAPQNSVQTLTTIVMNPAPEVH